MKNDGIIFTSAPLDADPAQRKAYDALDSLGIKYEGVSHEHADTIEQCLAIEDVLKVKVCKNLFLCNQQKTKFYLLLMPGDKKFKTKLLSKQINSARLSFADSENMMKYLGVTPGSVSVLGLINDTDNEVSLIIDEDLLKDGYIGCHPCLNTATLKIKTDDIINKFLPSTGHSYITVNLKETEEQ